MGLCSKETDPTIIQIDFGMISNELTDNLAEIDQMCADIELLYIKFNIENEKDERKLLY